MVTETIGIRELQQHASKLVRDVEQGRAEYRITVQGRDTGVMVTSAPSLSRSPGVLASDVMNSPWWQYKIPEDIRQKMLDDVEAGRDASGYVGDGGRSHAQPSV